MRITMQAQRPEQHTRRPDGIVPSEKDVHAGANVGNLEGRLSPWQGKLEDIGGVESMCKVLVEELRLQDREQGDCPGDQVVDGGVGKCDGVDLPEGAEGCTAAVDSLVVAHEWREEDVCDGGQDGNVQRPGVPGRDDNLLHVRGDGFREGGD